jgi:hypothetical protein
MGYTQEQFIGSGDLHIDVYDAAGARTGELDVGNAILFAINAPAVEKKERVGFRNENFANIIKSVVTKIEQELKFTLTDINRKNLALAMFGTDAAYTQSAGNNLTTDETTWLASTAYALDDIVVPTADNMHTYKCTTAGTSDATEPATWPTDGSTVTDGTVVWTDQGVLNDVITAHHDKWTKLTPRSLDPANLPVVTDVTGVTTYTKDTDYEVDTRVGRIKVLSTGAIADAATIHVGSTWLAITSGYKVDGLEVSTLEAYIRLVGEDQANSRNCEVIVYKAQIEPSGDLNWLSEDFVDLEFTGKILDTDDGSWDVLFY